MNILRCFLVPFALLYGGAVFVRNKLYNRGIFKSFQFDIPTIAVGNLSYGGTGKTPHIKYLIDLLINNYKVAYLSRGYRRKTKGYYLANEFTSVKHLGG